MRVEGVNRLKQRLSELQRNIGKDMAQALTVAAFNIQNEARTNIQTGSRSGTTYKRRSVTHRASAPGEYPKTDTGQLVSSIFVQPRGNSVFVGSALNYARFLEFGTSNMAARPWLRRSMNNVMDKNRKIVRDAYKRSVEGVTRGR